MTDLRPAQTKAILQAIYVHANSPDIRLVNLLSLGHFMHIINYSHAIFYQLHVHAILFKELNIFACLHAYSLGGVTCLGHFRATHNGAWTGLWCRLPPLHYFHCVCLQEKDQEKCSAKQKMLGSWLYQEEESIGKAKHYGIVQGTTACKYIFIKFSWSLFAL